MSKFLGLDYGNKHIGVAISDEGKTMAFPREEIINDKEAIYNIKQLVDQEGITKIIVGLPIGLKGQPTEQTERVIKFIDQLKTNLPIEIIEEDERMTSKAALNLLTNLDRKTKKKKVHSSSAIIILQDYLHKHA
ncbi:Holliday junction resolvase RuvX [Patescibacteria group bacterium]|nr:Holliday junction resolvase RuvX [Patescibacteria group bacterium]